jgi:glycyl-tRNA synthetase
METALVQLKERVPALLDDIRLSYGEIHIFGTPRRLVVRVDQLAARQPDETLVIKGPPAARAFDASGAPTQAAIGFARGKGIPVEDLKVQEIDGGQYVAAQIHQTGKSAIEVLSDAQPGLIAGLRFD